MYLFKNEIVNLIQQLKRSLIFKIILSKLNTLQKLNSQMDQKYSKVYIGEEIFGLQQKFCQKLHM